MYLGSTTTTLTEEYLSEKYPMVELEENVMINASSNAVLAEMVSNLEPNQVILEEKLLHFTDENQEEVDFDSYVEFNEDCLTVMNTWDIFSKMTLLFGKISIFDGRQKIKPIRKVL
jgi:hypothetical protein